MIGDIRKLLLIPHIKVHNANALSSPFTIGFPAMTAWLGATHALERKLKADGFSSLIFKGVAVVSHMADLQTYKGTDDYVYSIVGTANPLDKDGGRSAFIEEARIHLDVSILIEYEGVAKNEEDRFIERVEHHLKSGMKMAGGDVFGSRKLKLFRMTEDDERALGELRRSLMPGHVIVERRELMKEAMENGYDAIDALLEYLSVHHHCEITDDEVIWSSKRKTTGWIVPLAIGFQGISELGKAMNQRDPDTPHRFAESVVTLGEFKMPYKITSLDEMLWHYHVDQINDLYLCQQTTVPASAN
ncbi:MAG TPA: type I-F CRISPR-associated protein Csy2 [Sulfurovum sp. UBA12169]|nr:MAG TPA: type I-F CRISPR-associated protein Csy2 [Sulfurovum sp. UBA12169]